MAAIGRTGKKAFTLIEMLLVIGIIAVLLGAVMMGVGRMTKTAQRARIQELVTNTADALSTLLQKDGAWPKAVRNDQTERNFTDEAFARTMATHGLMGVAHSGSGSSMKLLGGDRFGIVLPQAANFLKQNVNARLTTSVPGGWGTVKDCRLRYAVDVDGDGITKVGTLSVRASAIAWWAPGGESASKTYSDKQAIISWRKDQVATK